MGLEHFDNWASIFGETVTAMELNVMKMFDRKKNKAEYQKLLNAHLKKAYKVR